MRKDTIDRILYIYRLVYCAVTAICAMCLMLECVSLYKGDSFSREAVAEKLAEFSVLLYIFAAMTVLNFVFAFLLPTEEKSAKRTQTPQLRLMRLKLTKRLDGNALSAAKGLQRKRLINLCCLVGGTAVVTAGFLAAYIVFCNRQADSDINGFIVSSMRLFIPFSVIAVAGVSVSELLYDKRLTEEIRLYNGAQAATDVHTGGHYALVLRAAIIALGIGLFIWGYCGGGFRDVLTKANNICTECIGLG